MNIGFTESVFSLVHQGGRMMTTVSRLVLGFLIVLAIGTQHARADRIILSGGGQVKGKLLAKPDASGKRVVIGERGKVPLTLRPEQIVQVIDEPGPLDGYVLKRNSVPETAQDHHNLALWCEFLYLFNKVN